MNEKWKKIGETDYEVSSFGSVRHIKNGIKKQNVHKNGYASVSIWFNGKEKRMLVHRIVAKAFIGNVDKLEVNHKDFNKLNNFVGNLEIVTSYQNIKHAKDGKRFKGNKLISGEKNPSSKLTSKEVILIRKMKLDNFKYAEILSKFDIKKSQLSNILSGKSWKNVPV
jgi:hypothetical protein